MSISLKYLSQEEYDRDWEPKYQAVEKKYNDDSGNFTGSSNDYDDDHEKLDYSYAKTVAIRIHQKLEDSVVDCKSALEAKNYSDFEKKYQDLADVWQDLNTPFHKKMTARTILEKD